MSGRELTRVEVLSRVKAGTLSLKSAAPLLAVSYRQAKRLVRPSRAESSRTRKSAHRGALPFVDARAGFVGVRGSVDC
jgi:hypothetical protein